MPFDYAVANGFDAFEWFPDKKPGAGWDDSDLDSAERARIKEAAKEKRICLSVHARWQANPLHPEAWELLLKEIQLAKDLGAVLLNIHLYHEAGIGRYIDAISPLIQQTAENGLQLSIENTPEHSPEQFNDLFARLRKMDAASHVGMCLDLGHANLSGATRNDYLAFVDRLGSDVPITHLHLHENWGDGDTHLTLFTGPAGQNDSGIRGFVEMMRRRKFSGSIIFEQWPQPPSLLNQARERLLALFESNEKPAAGPKESDKQAEVGRGVPTVPNATTQPAKAFLSALLEGDKKSRSWREKLNAVRELLVSKDSLLDEEALAYVAIYLRFLSAGQIACVEDGRHFRPGHHARISEEIQERLAKVSTPKNAYIVRKIYATLPSSSQEFQRAEPLTRIRDIAHRNDIPSGLKREIKTTLQNKLHRCAGPEDLETSKKLLERITAREATYPAEFVEQFRIFHEELKEFFNASSLDERLAALEKKASDEQADLIRVFLERKSKTGFENQVTTLGALTALRHLVASVPENKSSSVAQEFVLADIGLEDFAFVLLSQLVNTFEASDPRRSGMDLLEPLVLTGRNLAMSGISREEWDAINAELDAWRENFDPRDNEQLLRMKATIERSRRLAESFSERLIESMLSRVEKLGRALGVEEHAIQVFCEAEIRSHLVFQLSKLTSILLRRLREALALPGWDVFVSGKAFGRARVLQQLEDLNENGTEPVIAVLKKAEGDEEIPKSVRGILLAHEIPYLSHLAVRARQAGVVFVGLEDTTKFLAAEKLNGQIIRLEATPDKVKWISAREEEIAAGEFPSVRRELPTEINALILQNGAPLIIPIAQVTVETGGRKAFGLRKLKEVTSEGKVGFAVPDALVVPFGVMEKALSANEDLNEEYRKLAKEMNSGPDLGQIQTAERTRNLIENLRVPDEVTSRIARTFREGKRLMVRSSANCEDLEDFAGAGLYESFANVQLSDAASAILRVWSSLWTRRAVLSRNRFGIMHERARMAVIIQQMIAPEYSFILHTVNPLNRNAEELYMELAVGLGETLASAAERGSPYRLVCNKKTAEVNTLAFANFSHALKPDLNGTITKELLVYSRVTLSRRSELRQDIARRTAEIGTRVENEFGTAQDIEGAIMGNEIYLVQSRPQQGL